MPPPRWPPQGVPLVDLSSDQDTTDLTKCVVYVERHIAKQQAAAGAGSGAGGADAQPPAPAGSGQPAASAQQQEEPCILVLGEPGRQGVLGHSRGHGQRLRHPFPATSQPHAPALSSRPAPTTPPRPRPRPHLIQVPHTLHPSHPTAGALGGRLDHTLANLNTLYMFPHLNITLAGDGNLVRLLRAGRTEVHPDEAREGPTCALVPLAGPVVASSSGLKWNLDQTEVGGGARVGGGGGRGDRGGGGGGEAAWAGSWVVAAARPVCLLLRCSKPGPPTLVVGADAVSGPGEHQQRAGRRPRGGGGQRRPAVDHRVPGSGQRQHQRR